MGREEKEDRGREGREIDSLLFQNGIYILIQFVKNYFTCMYM